METVRITAPDLARRAAIAKSHRRVVVAIVFFIGIYAAVTAKLTDATVLQPVLPSAAIATTDVPKLPPRPAVSAGSPAALPMVGHAHRAPIIDRNGQILAISLPMATAYADPRQVTDPAHAADELATVLPGLDVAEMTRRLGSNKAFVYVARDITPEQEIRVNDLGIPGVAFLDTEVRRYPLGVVAAQTLGNVDRAGHGDMGLESYFDKRLTTDPKPLRLSIDVRVQAVVRDVLEHAFKEFTPVGAAGIVMNVNTGEVLASVSLPDYDANDFDTSTPKERYNRAVQGAYEPGSILKLVTFSMGLDYGVIHVWDEFDAIHPIHIGRFTITDFEGEHRWLSLPEVLIYSSNLGASHIALAVGAKRQRAWLERMGLFSRVPIQLPEAGWPMFQSARQWGKATVMTVGFGEGITEPPMQIVRDVAAIVNGGVLRPATLLAVPPDTEVPGQQVLRPGVSLDMRKMMRLVVAGKGGTGGAANVPGYFVGGKTGTAALPDAHGYHAHLNVSAFVGAFPINAPKYIVYMMLDAPHGNKSTGFFSTAGEVAAPAVGKVIARIGPMLGLLPATGDAAKAAAAEIALPVRPPMPAGVPPDVIPDMPPAPNGSTIPGPTESESQRRVPDQRPRTDASRTVHKVALR